MFSRKPRGPPIVSAMERAFSRYQQVLAAQVVLEDRLPGPVSLVGGVDVSYSDATAYAAACTLSFPGMQVVECSECVMPAPHPYRFGLLAMREGPPAARALRGLDRRPHLLFVNGGGVDHPRGLGLASHLGVVLDLPTVGVTRQPVAGEVRGDAVLLGGRRVGTVLRDGAETAYVSPGHLVSVDGAARWVRACAAGGTWPVPMAVAHQKTNQARRVGEAKHA